MKKVKRYGIWLSWYKNGQLKTEDHYDVVMKQGFGQSCHGNADTTKHILE